MYLNSIHSIHNSIIYLSSTGFRVTPIYIYIYIYLEDKYAKVRDNKEKEH